MQADRAERRAGRLHFAPGITNSAVNDRCRLARRLLASPRGSDVDFRILGPLEVVDDGRRLPIGQGRESALLALLLLRANEVIAADVLIEELWRGEPPATGAKSLQVYVSRLRKRLGADVIATRVPGYSVRVGRDQLDLLRFERLVEEAPGVEAPEAAAATLRDALSLWRGPPLAEFANEAWAQPEIGRLEELRLAALEDRIDADLALGRHADVVGELEVLVSGNPYRERLCGQLMLALYRSGRQAEALAAYRDTRRVLDEELGLEPGQELRELERRILAQDERLSAPRALHEEARGDQRPPDQASEAPRRPRSTRGAGPRGRHRHGGCGTREIGTAGSGRRAELGRTHRSRTQSGRRRHSRRRPAHTDRRARQCSVGATSRHPHSDARRPRGAQGAPDGRPRGRAKRACRRPPRRVGHGRPYGRSHPHRPRTADRREDDHNPRSARPSPRLGCRQRRGMDSVRSGLRPESARSRGSTQTLAGS